MGGCVCRVVSGSCFVVGCCLLTLWFACFSLVPAVGENVGTGAGAIGERFGGSGRETTGTGTGTGTNPSTKIRPIQRNGTNRNGLGSFPRATQKRSNTHPAQAYLHMPLSDLSVGPAA